MALEVTHENEMWTFLDNVNLQNKNISTHEQKKKTQQSRDKRVNC